MHPTVAALLLNSILIVPLCAHAWDSEGHMAVAYVAYQQLTPTTRTRVKALLALNPYATDTTGDPTKWPALLAKGPKSADPDLLTFMLAATWPDEIRSDANYHDDGPAGGDRPPTDGTADRNTGYDDFARHKYWHFVDTPFSPDGTALPAIPTPNAQTEVVIFRGVLKSSQPDALKSYDLAWLLHLVGDLHQPLHCATRVTKKTPSGDNGGNGVTVSCTKCPSKLHAYWDDLLGTSKALGSTIKAAKVLPAADAAKGTDLAEAHWVDDSFADAKSVVYDKPPIGAGTGPFALTTTYQGAAKKLGKERIALAGTRLANILNADLK